MRKTKRMIAVVIAVMMIFTAFPMTANAATKNVYNFNVSNSKVTKNASEGKLPADANPVYVGGKYYFNLQVSNDIKLKIAELYIKYPGSNKFDKKHIENAKNFMRYAYTLQSVGNKEGELTYYWKVMNTSGKWKSQAKKTVKVVKKPVTSIALNKSNIKINVGSAYKLTATVKPSDATYKNVSWSSKDSRVASVDKNGNVTAKKTGKTTVTATADGKSASCTVEVVQVKVTPKNISSCSITIPDVTYTGKPLTPEPVVKDGSKILKKGTDYTTQYSNNVNAGTGKVVITGKGNYTGSVTKTFTINKANDSISFSFPVVAYSTKVQTPKIKVTSKWNLKLSAKSSNNKVKVSIKDGYLTINVPAKFTGDATITVSSAGNANVNGTSVSKKISISGDTYKQSTVTITKKGQIVDTFNGVPAKYIPGTNNSNTGQYCCAQYVKNYYKKLFGIDVYNLMKGRTPKITNGKGSFKKLKSWKDAKPGDVVYHENSSGGGHWMILKSIENGKLVVIEQNYKWKSGSKTLTYKNRHITPSSAKNLKVFRYSK